MKNTLMQSRKRAAGIIGVLAGCAVVAVIVLTIYFRHYHTGALLKTAHAQLEAGDFLGARKRYRQIVNKEPVNFAAHYGLGMSHCAETIFKTTLGMAKTEDWHPAIYHMTIALNLNENAQAKQTLAVLHFNLGVFFQKENNPDAAIESIRQAVAFDPGLLKAVNLLGALYHERGNLEEATVYYEKALALEPDYAMAHFNLGAVAWAQDDFGLAVSHFEKAVSLAPDNRQFQAWLAKAQHRAGE